MEAGTRRSFAEASKDLLRQRVLDSVGELAGHRPWSEVKMADIADRSGVSRQTLYNTFGSRQELAQAYVMREAKRFVDAVEVAVHEHAPDPRGALRAALEIFLTAAQTHPLIQAVTTSQGEDGFLPLVTTGGGPLVGEVTARLTDLICDTWRGLPRADAELVADCLVRLAISHATLPAGTPECSAEAISRVLGPHLEELLVAVG